MKAAYLERKDKATLGRLMSGNSGTGSKYWTTSFDQIEDADQLAQLHAQKLGIAYDNKADYRLIIIDTEKAKKLSELTSVTATFEHIGAFANKELPKDFSKAFTDQVMNSEFQNYYAEIFQQAAKKQIFDDWDNASKNFGKFLLAQGYTPKQAELLVFRFKMHDKIGNNEHYLGNGLTKNLAKDGQQYGVVELLNFEHKIVNIAEFQKAGAIKILPLKSGE